ncbi:MAG TPA: hypothetical protein VEH04_15625 [Verrucomicrobiae bacterium]|nr:hypothetical protein [Verrucomicrobiae bacterium]
MKSSYELAMERLSKTAPTVKLTAEKKAQLADLDSRYAAKIAEREIAAKGEMDRAAGAGDFAKYDELQQQLGRERKALQTELEEKKEQVRSGK